MERCFKVATVSNDGVEEGGTVTNCCLGNLGDVWTSGFSQNHIGSYWHERELIWMSSSQLMWVGATAHQLNENDQQTWNRYRACHGKLRGFFEHIRPDFCEYQVRYCQPKKRTCYKKRVHNQWTLKEPLADVTLGWWGSLVITTLWKKKPQVVNWTILNPLNTHI